MGCKYHGGHGVTKDKAVAAHWFRKAADGGCTGAQIMLGSMHESGDGVPLDLNVAKQLYTRAAARGDDVAFCSTVCARGSCSCVWGNSRLVGFCLPGGWRASSLRQIR